MSGWGTRVEASPAKFIYASMGTACHYRFWSRLGKPATRRTSVLSLMPSACLAPVAGLHANVLLVCV
jgi:hypothetical protein